MRNLRRVLLLSASACVFAGSAASAQEAEAEGAEEQADNVIIVTGVVGSRGTNRLETSISVSSVSGEMIQNTNPTNIAEIFRQLPGIRSESSSGGGNSNINVRGIPVSTGGAKFLSFQEDGLPVLLFGDHLFAPADGFVKADGTLARVESVRGGTASTLTTNGPGGIINLIGKTGKQGGGNVMISSGLDYDDFRIDADFGATIGDDLYFHIGGHYQQGGDFRDSGYDPIQGGQVRVSLTKEFDGGYVRLIGKMIDKKEQAYFPQLVSRTDDGTGRGVVGNGLGTFSVRDNSNYSNLTRFGLAVNGRAELEPYDAADGLDHQVRALGFETNFDLGGGITLDTKTRYQDISGQFLGFFTDSALRPADLAGSTYFNGPLAGQAVTAANLPNGVASNIAVFDVNLDDMSNFANDIRLSKSFDLSGSSLDLTVGHFFMNQNFQQDWHWSRIVTTAENDAALISTPGAINGLAGVNQAFGWDGSNRNYDLEAQVSSPFAALAWSNDALSIDGSIRYDQMSQNGVRLAAAGGAFDLNNDGAITGSEATVSLNRGVADATADLTADNFAWSIGANYLLGDSFSVFARASSGASFNFDRALDFPVRDGTGALRPGAEGAYVDNVDQYELGFKLQGAALGGGSLDVYGTAFLSKTEETNIVITPPSGQVREYEAKGIELETYYRNGVFNLYATATYTDAEITDALDAAGNTVAALVGNRPQRQAELIWAVTPTLDFDRFSLTASWVGTTDSFASDFNDLRQRGYSVVHLTGAVNLTDSLQLSLNVNNLFNATGITESANDGRNGIDTNGDGRLDTTIGRSIFGRTTVARLRYSF